MKTTALLKQIQRSSLCAGLLLHAFGANSQCNFQITAEAGSTQVFPCNEVTVISGGDAFDGSHCNSGPYRIGFFFEGSYTFTFAQPVTRVSLNLYDLMYIVNPNIFSDVSLEINGLPFPFPNAGSPNSCNPFNAIVSPTGTLQCPPCPAICSAGCENVTINTSITSITVKNVSAGGIADGVTFSIFFCGTSAGVLSNAPITICENQIANFAPATNTYLETGQILQYALYEDPNDPIGSILAVSNTPSFSFLPGSMTTNATYYMSAIAGENLNGNVNLNSSCVAISNPVEVLWKPLPGVAFSAATLDICKGGCTTITLNFNGEPPFNLVYQTSFGGPFTSTFQDPLATLEICPPNNYTSDSFNLQAISVSDQNCTCQ